ncbi:MAG: DUF805 domain-containing protein [Aquamicrobium sp.]|uniref:DUF805 domain-containing protein n=1 Tax=Aquamicrobium sp. TaxID=1872579 RepID=UPI00349E91CA|nr:DUF805 domain-containing protein [Aquamicrobium sp.]
MMQMAWLFFGFTGRIDRSVYALAGLFVFTVQMFIVYRYLQPVLGTLANGTFDPSETLTLSPMTNIQSGIFLLGQLAHIALAAKRIHDFGRSGFFALLFMFAGLVAYLALCLIPGTPGPNKHGSRSNAAK